MDIRTIYTVRNNETHRHTYYSQDCAPIGARPLLYYTGKIIRVQQADGSIKIAYLYGEKTYTYSVVELEEYRAEQRAKKEEEQRRKRALNAIMEQYNALTTEELEKIVKKSIDK